MTTTRFHTGEEVISISPCQPRYKQIGTIQTSDRNYSRVKFPGLSVEIPTSLLKPFIQNLPSLPIKRRFTCLKGNKDKTLIKGHTYYIICLYQDFDGDFMVEVVGENEWNIRCYASRFSILTP